MITPMMGACAHLFIVFAKPGIFVNTFTVKSKRNDNSVEHIHTSNVHVRSKKKKHETEEKQVQLMPIITGIGWMNPWLSIIHF
jgi:ribosomal protein S2